MATYVEPQTRNITKLFRTATPAEIEAGVNWYADAHEIATALARRNDVSVMVATGVLAAVSPLNSWGSNVNLAGRILAARGTQTSGYMGVGLAKANAIIRGAENIEGILNGDKIVNFYRAIVTSGQHGVCIDRHAYSLAVNTRFADDDLPRFKGKRYEAIADCYRRAAKILSREEYGTLYPAQVQAVVWTQWRRIWWSDGAFDSFAPIE